MLTLFGENFWTKECFVWKCKLGSCVLCVQRFILSESRPKYILLMFVLLQGKRQWSWETNFAMQTLVVGDTVAFAAHAKVV